MGRYTSIDTRRNQRVYPSLLSRTNMSKAASERFDLRHAGHVHPDGEPWSKCCRNDTEIELGSSCNCAFIDKRIDKHSPRDPDVKKEPFLCVHRTTPDGYLRVCAGWHACFGRKLQP